MQNWEFRVEWVGKDQAKGDTKRHHLVPTPPAMQTDLICCAHICKPTTADLEAGRPQSQPEGSHDSMGTVGMGWWSDLVVWVAFPTFVTLWF